MYRQVRAIAQEVRDRLLGLKDLHDMRVYARLYERHARRTPSDQAPGRGPFELVGEIELGLLLQEGLTSKHTLLDFGCGTGRLAVHVVPHLTGGHYIGTDISQTMLNRARDILHDQVPSPPCRISLTRQPRHIFPCDDNSVDMTCAFSVFTHIEHEDAYWHLKDALRITRPGGKFIFSCLPVDLDASKLIFLRSAERNVRARWYRLRDVVTSRELMERIAGYAGWKVVRWYQGDETNILSPYSDKKYSLGQSSCVLEKP